jgi:hypothetical protein
MNQMLEAWSQFSTGSVDNFVQKLPVNALSGATGGLSSN